MKIPYWQLIILPGLLFCVGFILNSIAVAANQGQMAVLMPGGCYVKDFVGDPNHVCMTHASHFKFLSDWVLIPSLGIASPGDFLIWLGEYTYLPGLYIWIAMIIRNYNE